MMDQPEVRQKLMEYAKQRKLSMFQLASQIHRKAGKELASDAARRAVSRFLNGQRADDVHFALYRQFAESL